MSSPYHLILYLIKMSSISEKVMEQNVSESKMVNSLYIEINTKSSQLMKKRERSRPIDMNMECYGHSASTIHADISTDVDQLNQSPKQMAMSQRITWQSTYLEKIMLS